MVMSEPQRTPVVEAVGVVDARDSRPRLEVDPRFHAELEGINSAVENPRRWVEWISMAVGPINQ